MLRCAALCSCCAVVQCKWLPRLAEYLEEEGGQVNVAATQGLLQHIAAVEVALERRVGKHLLRLGCRDMVLGGVRRAAHWSKEQVDYAASPCIVSKAEKSVQAM